MPLTNPRTEPEGGKKRRDIAMSNMQLDEFEARAKYKRKLSGSDIAGIVFLIVIVAALLG
ncbi:hypothetical protein [Citromicrobium sp. RCC1878]|uniref:hypothetical protein n=1 Tax=Citromicrobium sp. RCC1878 TaxID=1647103 RepID=UPI0012E0F3FA|nr:hypothetical protein [Citromicrobium sp. RCC1878]|tara:strand:- start:11311 stop:11490 length:180 start_codon:yes stop_codon:yes gene_type:complete